MTPEEKFLLLEKAEVLGFKRVFYGEASAYEEFNDTLIQLRKDLPDNHEFRQLYYITYHKAKQLASNMIEAQKKEGSF